MPGFVIQQGALTNCPHPAGIITAIPPAPPRVFINGSFPALTVSPIPTNRPAIAGCLFTLPGPKPSPCLQVLLTPATRVFSFAEPLAILTPAVLCINELQAPQGPPLSAAIQTRVVAT